MISLGAEYLFSQKLPFRGTGNLLIQTELRDGHVSVCLSIQRLQFILPGIPVPYAESLVRGNAPCQVPHVISERRQREWDGDITGTGPTVQTCSEQPRRGSRGPAQPLPPAPALPHRLRFHSPGITALLQDRGKASPAKDQKGRVLHHHHRSLQDN